MGLKRYRLYEFGETKCIGDWPTLAGALQQTRKKIVELNLDQYFIFDAGEEEIVARGLVTWDIAPNHRMVWVHEVEVHGQRDFVVDRRPPPRKLSGKDQRLMRKFGYIP